MTSLPATATGPVQGLKPGELLHFAHWLAAEFSNQAQSFESPSQFAHIHIFFRPLPISFFGAIGFYSEQAYDYDVWAPYRQGVHRLIQTETGIYVENYGLKQPIRYAGSGHEPSLLAPLTHGDLEQRCHCAMVFRWQQDHYWGEVEGKRCCIPKDGRMTYLVSEVTLGESSWISRDRGFDPETHEQVWGSTQGPLRFSKVRSLSEGLPVSASSCL